MCNRTPRALQTCCHSRWRRWKHQSESAGGWPSWEGTVRGQSTADTCQTREMDIIDRATGQGGSAEFDNQADSMMPRSSSRQTHVRFANSSISTAMCVRLCVSCGVNVCKHRDWLRRRYGTQPDANMKCILCDAKGKAQSNESWPSFLEPTDGTIPEDVVLLTRHARHTTHVRLELVTGTRFDAS